MDENYKTGELQCASSDGLQCSEEVCEREIDYRPLVRVRWLISAYLVLMFVKILAFTFFYRDIFDAGLVSVIDDGSKILCVLWALGGWQLTRIGLKSYRIGGWIMVVYSLFVCLYGFFINLLDGVFAGTPFELCSVSFLEIIGMVIITLAMQAFCTSDGSNRAAASLIIALNMLGAGLTAILWFSYKVTGTFVPYVGYISLLIWPAYIWLYWMFFKYSRPECDADMDMLTFKALVFNRNVIGVPVLAILMMVALYKLSVVILN